MNSSWPELPFTAWQDTAATLQLWTQVVGKVRLALTPWTNHSWHVTLYVTSRGLTTSLIYSASVPFEIEFDFADHLLRIHAAGRAEQAIALAPKSVAAFYGEVMNALQSIGVVVRLNTTPNEVDPAIPFEQDNQHVSYDAEYAHRFWQTLLQADRVFKTFRSEFCGKCSPVHFFWGSFDLAVTRFSGRRAPLHPGGIPHLPDAVTREAYSQEVSSLGFWPGGPTKPEPVFYSYAYPEPAGFPAAAVKPNEASYFTPMKEFLLPYEAVRLSPSPDDALLAFARSTYDAASLLGKWDRAALVENKPDLHSPSHAR